MDCNNTNKNRKTEGYNRAQFLWLYGEADVFDDKEVLAISVAAYAFYATTIEQAKGQLREKIRGLGGNAAIFLRVSRGTTTRTFSGDYMPAFFRAEAKAALVVPKQMSEEKKSELLAKFKETTRVEVKEEKEEKEETTYNSGWITFFSMAAGVGLLFGVERFF